VQFVLYSITNTTAKKEQRNKAPPSKHSTAANGAGAWLALRGERPSRSVEKAPPPSLFRQMHCGGGHLIQGVDQCYTQALSKAITELRLPATTPAHHPHSRSTRLLVAAAPSCEVPPPSGGHTDASHQRHASPDPGRRGNLRTAARFDPVTRDAVGKMPRCRCTRPRGSDACHARPTNGWPTIVARVRSLKVVAEALQAGVSGCLSAQGFSPGPDVSQLLTSLRRRALGTGRCDSLEAPQVFVCAVARLFLQFCPLPFLSFCLKWVRFGPPFLALREFVAVEFAPS